MNTDYTISYRFWITHNNEAFLGKGRVALLLKIDELGSLKKAAEALKMSYRKAYYAVSHMNKTSAQLIVLIKRGGAKGGSSTVTPHGLELIKRFQKLAQNFDDFARENSL